jgi:hypothetical protein
VSLLEAEYLTALLRAELDWLRAVTADIRDGRLAWQPPDWRESRAAAREGGQDDEEGGKHR